MDYKGEKEEEKAGLVDNEKLGKDGSFRLKLKALGSLGRMDMHFRADKIDLRSLDIHLARRMTKGWRSCKIERHMEEWEIDLSKLDLRQELARGTYATVYKGIYDGQDVAVKIMDWGEDGVSTEAKIVALRETFQKEVIVWHKLDHPNVTKFIGASVGSNELKFPQKSSTSSSTNSLPAQSCFVVVEFLAGGTLKQFLIRHSRRKLTYKTVVRLALDLSRGLSYLHAQKIVHRDVKTENVLLDKSANLKIADFGVARVEAQNAKDMTGETGTLGYMAPEVLNGKPYNRKCDVYSFGICLWEIYCCDMPSWNVRLDEISSAATDQNMRPQIPRCCPSALANIMKRCWHANPDKRPEMDEVVRLLEAIDTSKGGGMIVDGQIDDCQAASCFCFVSPIRGP